jgi:hypothetical protein
MCIFKTLKSRRAVAFGRLSLVEEETRAESVGLSQSRAVPARLGLEAPALAWPEGASAFQILRPSQSQWEGPGSGLARLWATAFQSRWAGPGRGFGNCRGFA